MSISYLERKRAHIKEVQMDVVNSIDELLLQIERHDYDKLGDAPPTNHRDVSRHHFLASHPDQIDLLDMLEMISDVAVTYAVKGGSAEIPMADELLANEFLRGLILNTMKRLHPGVPVTFHKISEYEH